jgi:flagellar protein FliO/FliZ
VTLALVLAAIFAFAAIARRLRGVSRSGGVVIRVVAEVQLGPKERAVLLEAGGTRLLVGVAPGRVSTLHVLPASAVIEEGAAAAPVPGAPAAGFRELLQRLMVPR